MDDGRRRRAACGTLDGVTHRLLLRPGVHVLRRSSDLLQVGLDPARAVVLPDDATHRTLLDALTSPGSARPEDYHQPTVGLLSAAGLVVDAATLLPLLPTGSLPASGVPRIDAAALAASDGDAVGGLVEARSRATARVAFAGGTHAQAVAGVLSRLLCGAGLGCAGPYDAATAEVPEAGPGRAGGTTTIPGAAALPPETGPVPGPGTGEVPVAVLVAVGEPARELTDGWIRAGTPHLLLRLVEGNAVVGPFVRPGETACLRCLDAHHTDVDPAWPLLVAQYAAAVARDREDAVPEPVDSVLATLAAAWAAREVLTAVEGRSPATSSTTVRLDSRLTCVETQSWPRHPQCGCAGL